MSNPMKQHGAFSWNELMTSDVAGAKAFYGKMFNWQMEDMEMDQPYTLATIDGEHKAGLMPLTPECGEMPPHWGAYVAVDDVEVRAKQAEALGGKILLEPRDIPTVGHMCVISDPQGAALTIISYFEQE